MKYGSSVLFQLACGMVSSTTMAWPSFRREITIPSSITSRKLQDEVQCLEFYNFLEVNEALLSFSFLPTDESGGLPETCELTSFTSVVCDASSSFSTTTDSCDNEGGNTYELTLVFASPESVSTFEGLLLCAPDTCELSEILDTYFPGGDGFELMDANDYDPNDYETDSSDPLSQCLADGLSEINPLFQPNVDPERDFDCMKGSDDVTVCDVSSFSESAAKKCESRGTIYVFSGAEVCDDGTTLYEDGFVCVTNDCDIDAIQELLSGGDESEDEDCSSEFDFKKFETKPSDGYYSKSKKSKSKKGEYSSKAPKSYSKSLKSDKNAKEYSSKSDKSAKEYSSKSDKSAKDYDKSAKDYYSKSDKSAKDYSSKSKKSAKAYY